MTISETSFFGDIIDHLPQAIGPPSAGFNDLDRNYVPYQTLLAADSDKIRARRIFRELLIACVKDISPNMIVWRLMPTEEFTEGEIFRIRCRLALASGVNEKQPGIGEEEREAFFPGPGTFRPAEPIQTIECRDAILAWADEAG